MTTIYFLPDKRGPVYLAPVTEDLCLMDTAVADVAGLLRELEQPLGIVFAGADFNERLCRYFSILDAWLDTHPESVMKKSFDLAPLSTTRRLLLWRDALKLAKWDFTFPDTASRLGALAAVESLGAPAGLADRIGELLLVMERQGMERHGAPTLYRDLRIIIPAERTLMRPLLRDLLDAAEAHGARVEVRDPLADLTGKKPGDNLGRLRSMLLSEKPETVKLDETDDSFRVLIFDTACDEAEYATVCRGALGADVTIEADSKQTDNRLAALHQPAGGSSIVSRSRILKMLPLAISLFDDYPDIRKLVEWLSSPVHPLPDAFRERLAETMAETGGFLNDACRALVMDFMGPEDDDRPRRENLVALYLPYINPEESDPSATLHALGAWARGKVAALPDDERKAEALQLGALADSIRLLFLVTESKGAFDLVLAREWVKEIPSEITMPQYPAQVGAAFTVAAPWDIAGKASSVVWIGMKSPGDEGFDCDFLLPGEREAIEAHADFWNRAAEGRYRSLLSLAPFLYARDRITLSVAEKDGGERVVPHPLLTRIRQQVSNYDAFVRRPSTASRRTDGVAKVDNRRRAAEYRFTNACNIRMPERMSATSLETFIVSPFDFLFDRILHLHSAGMAAISPLRTTRGNVAHRVVARLFSPRSHKRDASTIRKRVEKEFDSTYEEAVRDCGAILLLEENVLDEKAFRMRLRGCIADLLDIIDENGLEVVECERQYFAFAGLAGYPRTGEETDLTGQVDMRLEDMDARPVIFDLKWSESPTYHRDLLAANRSLQLAVYRRVLDEGDVPTGYFVMPRGILYTCSPFRGLKVECVTPDNDDDIMAQAVSSFRYRMAQLRAGIVEEAEEMDPAETAYGQDQSVAGLFPLPADRTDGTKRLNIFSAYGVFKGF